MTDRKYAENYTLSELMAVIVSRQVKDRDRVFIGIGVPMLGAVLATRTHAPNAIIAFEGGYVGGKPVGALWAVGDSGAAHQCTYATTMYWVFSDIQRGYFDVAVLGGAQIDKYGNLNTTAITGEGKTYRSPKTRLPGSGGANDGASHAHSTVVMMRLEKKRFVERVHYITSPGYIDGPVGREKAGLLRGGPSCVITDKCVFRFDETSKEMYLDSIHPGVGVEDVKKEVSWDLKIAPKISVSESPTVNEVELIQAMDPADIVLRVKRIYEKLDFFEWADTVERGWEKIKSGI
jgi:glutaconate CoA-transferase, subunit B